VFQQYAPIAKAVTSGGANHAVIGSWIVGDEPAGMGIREDDSPITRNTSRFVPHFFN
jgi:glutathionylspermidine synthase